VYSCRASPEFASVKANDNPETDTQSPVLERKKLIVIQDFEGPQLEQAKLTQDITLRFSTALDPMMLL
jgi:hypothetical protein